MAAELFKKKPQRISERRPISSKERIAKLAEEWYHKHAPKLAERYKADKEFRMRFNQKRRRLIEQGIDAEKLLFSFIPQHSALFQRSSIRFIANQLGDNQADENIDDSTSLKIKKIGKDVLLEAVLEVRPFDFPTQSDFKIALREAVEKACNQSNGMTPPRAWNLKLVSSEDSDKLVFESRDSALPDVEISIGAVLDELTACENFEKLIPNSV